MNNQVREHLRHLSLFHFVMGGVGYLISLVPCIHLAIGIFFLVAPAETFETSVAPAPAVANETGSAPSAPVAANQATPFPAKLFGLMFTVIASVIILCGFTISTLIIVAGKKLAAYRSHSFCMVMAGIECLFAPVGTVLGIFTILTLIKPEARELFGLPALNGEGGAAG